MSVGTAETFLEPDSTLESIELSGGEIEARTPWQAFWRRFRADRVAMVSAVFIVLLLLVACWRTARQPDRRNRAQPDDHRAQTSSD